MSEVRWICETHERFGGPQGCESWRGYEIPRVLTPCHMAERLLVDPETAEFVDAEDRGPYATLPFLELEPGRYVVARIGDIE